MEERKFHSKGSVDRRPRLLVADHLGVPYKKRQLGLEGLNSRHALGPSVKRSIPVYTT